MKTGSWKPAEDELALKYLNANKSFFEVGQLIDRPRNAVISRANRKGWSYPSKKIPGKNTYPAPEPVRTISPCEPSDIRAPLSERDMPATHGTVLLDHAKESHCRYILGEARFRLCCGQKTLVGHSWCAQHAPLVYGTTSKAMRNLIEAH